MNANEFSLPAQNANRHSWWRFPVLCFLVARVVLSLWAFVILRVIQPPAPIDVARGGAFVYQTLDAGLGYYWLEPWNRYDTHWYLKIAIDGYAPNDGSLAFFPLYPILIRAAGTLIGGQWLLAALLISNLAMLGTLIVLYRFVADQFDDVIARRTMVGLLIFPTAFFFFAAYTESLFVLFALLTLRGLQNRNWWRAGLFAGLATLTRAPGILLIVPMLYGLFVQRARLAHFLALFLPMIGGASYWLYLTLTFGDANMWARGVAFWRSSGLPGQSILAAIQLVFTTDYAIANNLIDLAATLFFIGMIIVGFTKLPPLLSLYSLAVILPPLVSIQTIVARLPLASLPRYGIIAFPIFITLALMQIHRRWKMIGVTLALVLQALFVALFVNWIWIA